jgi:hypothetical protein
MIPYDDLLEFKGTFELADSTLCLQRVNREVAITVRRELDRLEL